MRERFGAKLGQFAKPIERVSIRLENVSGCKGAPLCVSRAKVVLPRLDRVVIEKLHSDLRSAIDLVVEKAERTVRTALGEADSVPTRRRARSR